MHQPRPASTQAAIPAQANDRETSRLLSLWVDLTRRAASAAAHRTGQESSLSDLQQQVEEALTDRLDNEAVWPELWAWESTLIHPGDVPVWDCLSCHLARLELPEILSLVPVTGGPTSAANDGHLRAVPGEGIALQYP
jgi:hypothetical protein